MKQAPFSVSWSLEWDFWDRKKQREKNSVAWMSQEVSKWLVIGL